MAEVRPGTAADAAGVAAVYAPYVRDSVASFELEPPDADEMARRLGGGLPWYVAVEDSAVLGFAYAAPHRARPAYRWAVDCSVYVAQPGRGLGRQLYGRLLPVLRDLGHVRAHGGITLPNAASVALHEACGFTQVARFPAVGWKAGAWHDVGWWSLALREPPDDPVPPRLWDGVA